MKKANSIMLLYLCSALATAGTSQVMAVKRSNSVNYKDIALAACIAEAYKQTPAEEDAISTRTMFPEWTDYEDEKGNSAINELVDAYLKRDYSSNALICTTARSLKSKSKNMFLIPVGLVTALRQRLKNNLSS
jgi:hypothetical protein